MSCGSGVSMGLASLLKFHGYGNTYPTTHGSHWDPHVEHGPKETRRMCEQCILPLHMRDVSHFMVRCRRSSGLLLRLERCSLGAPGVVAINREPLATLLRPLALRLLGKL